MLRCFGYLRPHWPRTIGAYLALLGINALVLTIPQFIRWIVDQGIGGKDTFLLGWSVLALLGLTVVKGGLTFLQGQWTETISQNVAYDLRNDIHRKLSELSFSYHDQSETGQLLSRAVQDVDRIRFLTGRAVLRITDGVVLLIGTAAMLIWMNPSLAVAALLPMPLLRVPRFSLRQPHPPSLACHSAAIGRLDLAAGAKLARCARGQGICTGRRGDRAVRPRERPLVRSLRPFGAPRSV